MDSDSKLPHKAAWLDVIAENVRWRAYQTGVTTKLGGPRLSGIISPCLRSTRFMCLLFFACALLFGRIERLRSRLDLTVASCWTRMPLSKQAFAHESPLPQMHGNYLAANTQFGPPMNLRGSHYAPHPLPTRSTTANSILQYQPSITPYDDVRSASTTAAASSPRIFGRPRRREFIKSNLRATRRAVRRTWKYLLRYGKPS
jgi:hypothetical protein